MDRDNCKCEIAFYEVSNDTEPNLAINGALSVEIENTGANVITYTSKSGVERTLPVGDRHKYEGNSKYLIYDFLNFNFTAGASSAEIAVVQISEYDE